MTSNISCVLAAAKASTGATPSVPEAVVAASLIGGSGAALHGDSAKRLDAMTTGLEHLAYLG